MGGVFGGLLDVVHKVGGGLLFLLIGSSAFKKEARNFSLFLGGVIIGGVIAAVVYYFNGLVEDFIVAPFSSLLVVMVLEGARRWIEEEY